MDICHQVIDITKEGLINALHLVTPVTPYLLGVGNTCIGEIILGRYWAIQMVRQGLEVHAQ